MRSVALAVALLSLGACSTLPAPSVHPAPAPPLRAYITPPSRLASEPLGFHVSRPAYVALFDVVPGQGVSLLYPGYATGSLDGRAFGGYTRLSYVRPMNLDQYRYAGYASTAAGAWTQPHFFFLIASERPLNVERFGSWGSRLWTVLGNQFFATNPYDTMEELARYTVPQVQDDESWTSDVYVYWPDVVANGPREVRRTVLLTCANGYTFEVPATMIALAKARVCDPLEAQASDSARATRPVKPSARKPLPKKVAEDLTGTSAKVERRPIEPSRLRERITASAQLDAPDEPTSPSERARLQRWGGEVSAGPGARGTPRARPGESHGTEVRSETHTSPASTRAQPERRTSPEPRATPRAQPSTPRTAPSPPPHPMPAPEKKSGGGN